MSKYLVILVVSKSCFFLRFELVEGKLEIIFIVKVKVGSFFSCFYFVGVYGVVCYGKEILGF